MPNYIIILKIYILVSADTGKGVIGQHMDLRKIRACIKSQTHQQHHGLFLIKYYFNFATLKEIQNVSKNLIVFHLVQKT